MLKTIWMWFREKEGAIVSPLWGFLLTRYFSHPDRVGVGYILPPLPGLKSILNCVDQNATIQSGRFVSNATKAKVGHHATG